MEKGLLESTFVIGGISVRLSAGSASDAFEMEPAYEQFLLSGGSWDARKAPDVDLTVRCGIPPEPGEASVVFDSGGLWKLLQRGETYYVPLSTPAADPQTYRMLVIDKDLTRGDIYSAVNTGAGGRELHVPLKYPLDEVLMVNVFSREKGVKLHALGIDYKGHGIIFSGYSGAGKSTTAELWKQRREATLLSDESVLVRPGACNRQSGNEKTSFVQPSSGMDGHTSGGYCLYGTPWHGDAGVSTYGGVPLKRILFLKQATENELVALTAIEATTALIVRCFPTFWDSRGMDFTVDLIGRICSEVPCFELRFKPEQAALDLATEGI